MIAITIKIKKKTGLLDAVNLLMNILVIAFALFAFLLLLSSYLSQKEISFLGLRSYIILSGSMSPAFDEGSYILVQEKPADKIQPGDILTYRIDEKTVLTHRVAEAYTENGLPVFITQGDANNVRDVNPVTADRVIGTPVFWVNGLGKILLSLHNPRNFVFCILILLTLFIIPDLLRYAFRKTNEAKTNEANGKEDLKADPES